MSTTTVPALRIVPLGGLGHIGGNMMALETPNDLVVVDCGVLFPDAAHPGVDYLIPNIDYVRQRRHKLRAILITHGHEDHIGALPYVLNELRVPVFATRFTRGLINDKLTRFPHVSCDLRPFNEREKVRVGDLEVEPIAVTHSIPHAVSLAIDTPIGLVLHTGDFKIDRHPVDGRHFDDEGFRAAAARGIRVLLSDSTNSTKEGHTWSESALLEPITTVMTQSPHRVYISMFSSNIFRIQTVLRAAQVAGRRVVSAGRRLSQNIQLARDMGLLEVPPGVLVDLDEVGAVDPHRLVVLASGSQGEPNSTLDKLASDRHRDLVVEHDDCIVFSSRKIPGNERPVGKLMNDLARLGAEIIDDRAARVHTSGHAFRDEQRHMLELCRPQFFVPVHGEYRHLVAHGDLAVQTGVSRDKVLITQDGSPLSFYQHGDAVSAEYDEPIAAGHDVVEGTRVYPSDGVVLRDRRALGHSGFVGCVVLVDRRGHVVGRPEILTRGVVPVDENTVLLDRVATEVGRAVSRVPRDAVHEDRLEAARLALRRFFRRELDRRPVVVAVVHELGDPY